MNRKLLEILACPICKAEVDYKKNEKLLIWHKCKVGYHIRNEIPVMTPEEATDYIDGEKTRWFCNYNSR